jgi:hypothetical protein
MGETSKPRSETSVVSNTEQPNVAAKVLLRERRETETKTKERKLKGELRGELCSAELATTMCILYTFF